MTLRLLAPVLAAGLLAATGCSQSGDDTPAAVPDTDATTAAGPTTVSTAATSRRAVEPAAQRAEFFAPDSVWNARLDDDAPLDPESDRLAAELRRQVQADGTSVSIRTYSTPVYRAPADAPTRRVILDNGRSPKLQAAFDEVPLPEDARPAEGTDGNLVVWQPSTDTVWEFWRFTLEDDGPHADWGGRMTDVRESPGVFRDRVTADGEVLEREHWGVTATKLARLGGLVTVRELERGRIDHALAFSIPHARKGVYSPPAKATDGRKDDPDAIPEGARFRLDPDLDVEALDVPPLTKMLARAAQRHGMILQNQAGSVVFYAEDPRTADDEAVYDRVLDGTSPNEVAEAFPWDHVQALPGEERRQNR